MYAYIIGASYGTQRHQTGIDANQETWELLSKQSRSEEENDQMIAAAYSQNYLWEKGGGTALNKARGHWLISRVMCVVGEPRLAARHAELCARFTEEATDRTDFDVAYAVEAEARAAALNGDRQKATELRSRAEKLAEAVADPEDRKILVDDLTSEPWFGVSGSQRN